MHAQIGDYGQGLVSIAYEQVTVDSLIATSPPTCIEKIDKIICQGSTHTFIHVYIHA